jgi:hypothetical protein
MARTKLINDLTKAYEFFVENDQSVENTPQILLSILKQIGIIRNVANISEVNFEMPAENLSEDPNLKPEKEKSFEIQQKTKPENEKECLKVMWKLLSFGGREVTKSAVTNLIHSMLSFEETQLFLLKESEEIQGQLGIEQSDEMISADIRKMLLLFGFLSKECKMTGFIHHFAAQLKPTQMNQQKEEEQKECRFAPKIDKKSRVIDTRKAQESKGKFKGSQRSQSPKRHDMLYENFKEQKEKLLKKEEEINKEKNKELTFKPKISDKANSRVEDQQSKVFLIHSSSNLN